VYGGGSFAPNRGAVSAQGAQGYLRREIKKQNTGPFGGVSAVGRDGQSNTRSGVAQNILKRRADPTPQRAMGGGSGIIAGDNKPKPPIKPTTGGGGKDPIGNTGPMNPNGNPTGPSTPVPPPVPTVVVSPTGQLNLPYDQQFSSEVLAALDQYNNELMDLQLDQQQEGLDYTIQRRDADSAYTGTKRSTLASNAARGTAFSSQYGTAVANNAQQYQNKIGDLDTKHSMFGQNNELRRAGILTAFQRMLSQSAMDYGNDLSEDAGNLGLDGNGGTGGTGSPSVPPSAQMPQAPNTPGNPNPWWQGNWSTMGVRNPPMPRDPRPGGGGGGKKKPPKK
jgi:hypothetical protein